MDINYIIIEDEPLAMLRIKQYAQNLPFLKILGAFDNALEAIVFMQTGKVDLIFLDIQMDGLSGIQFLESIKQRPEVIITTAFDEYAVKGFELEVADYLVKPFPFERFLQAVMRVQNKLKVDQPGIQQPYIFVRSSYQHIKIFWEDILFIEGVRDYRKINCRDDKKIMTSETFTTLESKLPGNQFCRVHKSFLISVNKIESVEKDRIKIQNKIIPISEMYRADFYKLIK
ncbi:response regulator transcription factor [Niastella caeni]|uniref:Response regulator transcription factor n=1 Tax=Niastella caeni TaxID=2569763 RepID=A0A4S8HIG6_9BACT|nr:response regulator transcription factor [Niastella caeni]THU34917.1 response regulator transcription factor [Niastella caeni]